MNEISEWVGYGATIVLVASFLPGNIWYVRAINFFACLLFVVYGILLGYKLPIIISNAAIAIIQLYHLFFKKKKTVNNSAK